MAKSDGEQQATVSEPPKQQVPTDADQLEFGPYVDGFSRRTVLGALFVALIMMPGAVFLGLVVGQSLGGAAEWVTIILFAEVARRSFTSLKRQEVYVLFYVASSIAAVTLLHLALSGGPIATLIWNQYLVQNPETSALAPQIPDWVVPPLSSDGMMGRDLLHKDWWFSASKGILSPIILIAIGYIFGRLSWFGLGYILFRLTSDTERLPFPLAPVAAEGATALAESTERDPNSGFERRKISWRWRVFSSAAALGIMFGAVYVALPMVSGLFMARPVMLLPIPFVDLTPTFENILPGSLMSISFDAAIFIMGMILPIRLVWGTFIAVMLTSVFGNPVLYHLGVLEYYQKGNALLVNQLVLGFDFWISVTIGLAAAVALIGIISVIKVFARGKKTPPAPPPPHLASDPTPYRRPSKERGDFPIWLAALLFVIATAGFAAICHILVPDFPMWIVLAFGFIWTPINSYVSARLMGYTGMPLAVPYIRETAFILSGYRGVDIWFAPIPLADNGAMAQRFRELELTRTKFTSIFKAELLMFPIIFAASFLFWWFFWKVNQIPSSSFPFAARMWPIAARNAYVIFTANSAETPLLLEAIKPLVIIITAVIGLVLYGGLSAVGMTVVFYGMVGGVNQPFHMGFSLLLGALVGRYYFRRKFGEQKWSRYVPVVAAGFACGTGLAAMIGAALMMIVQSTRDLPF